MNFKKLSLVTAMGAALVGCGADDQAYEYVDRDVYEYALSSLTAGTPRKISDENCVDCYEIPVDGLWLFQQSMGDLSRTSRNTPYAYDYINGERLVKLKFTKDGLVAELVEGDITFEGETTRFPQEHNEPRLFTITGTYEGYQCKEDSYGDCTNAEEKISDPNVRWWQKTHFTPDFVSLDMHDEQYFFEKWLGDKQSKSLTHLEFDPKNAGVINIEHEHNIVSKAGNPEKADVFYSLVRLDKLATPGYQAVHYDLEEHNRFGFFKTSYEKLDDNYISNQNGYEGYFVNRFDPRKDRIEYQLSDEFFRKDANGNLVNKVWLDATIKGFEYINNSLQDRFSPNGRLIPEIVITNKTEAVNAKVGDIRSNVIHIVPEASRSGLLGFGPSTVNPLTGEIVSAYTIMYPGVSKMGVSSGWDELVRLYNKDELSSPYNQSSSQGYSTYNSSSIVSDVSVTESQLHTANTEKSDLAAAKSEMELPAEEVRYEDRIDIDVELAQDREKMQHMMANNMYPAELYSVSSKIVANKTDITELDFVNQGYFVNPDAHLDYRKLKSWSDLTAEQRSAVTHAFTVHQYLTTLVHEIGHNIGLRHNFAGSFDHHNFYTAHQAQSLGLKGISATSSIMDYTPSEINVHPAFGLYDRAALRFAYQRKVEVHQEIDEERLTNAEINSAKAVIQTDMYDLAELDQAKRNDLSQKSALSSLVNGSTLNSDGKEVKYFGFCTDGRGRSNSETGCLVFDEGTSHEEITQSVINRYNTTFESRTARRDRVEFNENSRYLSKFITLHRTFDRGNMVADDYAREYRFSEKLNPIQACISPSNSEQENRCDITRAAYKQAYFYLDLLKLPEKTCEVDVTVHAPSSRGGYEEIYQVRQNWPLSSLNWVAGITGGNVYSEQNHLPNSCFDEKLVNALDAGFRPINGQMYDYSVIAESKHGNFLNKVTLTNRASSEYASYIGYEVDHLGIWLDKLLALEYLLKPSGLRGIDFALADLPGIRQEIDTLVNHWTLGTPLPSVSDQTEVSREFSKVLNPYEFVDSEGRTVSITTYKPDWTNVEISPTPGRLSWHLNRWYGTNNSGSTPISKALLYTITKNDSYRTDLFKPEAFELLEKIGLRDGGWVSSNPKYINILGETYFAGIDNSIGHSMISDILSTDTYKLKSYSITELNTHLESRARTLSPIIDASATAATASQAEQSFLKSSTEAQEIASFGLDAKVFFDAVAAHFNSKNYARDRLFSWGIYLEALWTVRDQLISSGTLVFDAEKDCYVLGQLGCMYTNNLDYAGTATSVAGDIVFRAWGIYKTGNTQSVSRFIAEYSSSYQNANLGELFDISANTIRSYVSSPAAATIKEVDDVGLRNLVIIDENQRVSQF